ncbi:type 1 glutamine amidotransferase [Leucobacter luti]|nr:type 1 glutamine amidotransferase [Leucobacter luti]
MLVVEHQGNAGLGHFAARLRGRGVILDTVGPDAGRDVPPTLDGYDGLIVLGGSMGPLDDEAAPWLPATRELLAEGVSREIPTLGICLGAQLLAAATGGSVRTAPAGPEVGLCAVDFAGADPTDPLFGGIAGSEVPVVQWHWLEAAELPAGARVLASSAACRNQAFRIGVAAWGVQFHPEALTTTAEDWVEEEGTGLDDIGLAGPEVIARVRGAEPRLSELWGEVAERFAEVVRD